MARHIPRTAPIRPFIMSSLHSFTTTDIPMTPRAKYSQVPNIRPTSARAGAMMMRQTALKMPPIKEAEMP